MGTVRMFDDVNVSLIPRDALAVAGYVNGKFLTWLKLKLLFPHTYRLSIAVTAGARARCLDIEKGDATIDQAPGWLHDGADVPDGLRPVLYVQLSNAQALVDHLAANKVPRELYDLFTAHYTHEPHICGPSCGFGLKEKADLTQWTDRSGGVSLDESLCDARVFGLPTGKIQFTQSEAHTLRLIMAERKRSLKGDSGTVKRRRSLIRRCKARIRAYRAAIRAAAAVTGWDRGDRRRRYAALLVVYNGGRVKL